MHTALTKGLPLVSAFGGKIMLRYIIRRILLLFPVLFGVSLLVFLVLHVFTVDPTSVILGQHATVEKQEALRQELGLNDPLYVQFGHFIGGAVTGDMGRSLFTKEPVIKEVTSRFPATIELTVVALLLASLVGIAVGIISAVKQYSTVDYLSMLGALLGVSMPIFWLGLIFIDVFAVRLGWLPTSGRLGPTTDMVVYTKIFLIDSVIHGFQTGSWGALGDTLRHIIMPAVVLGASSTAVIARMTRSSMLEVIRQDYVRTARAKGLSNRSVILKHTLKNAMIPIITVIGLQFGSLLGGAVLTETIFSWPGVGSLTFMAIDHSDFPLVQGTVLLSASVYVLVNLVVDLLYAFIDPRIHYA